jgi:hypothetical protein
MLIHEAAAARKMLLFVSYFSHAKQPAEKITMGVPNLWHLLKTFSHCCAAKTGEVFVANFKVLTPPAENAKMAPETNREEVIPAVATREVVSGMVAIKGQSAVTTLKGNY